MTPLSHAARLSARCEAYSWQTILANARSQAENASSDHRKKTDRSRLIDCPFEVRVDGALHDQFYDVGDALASALKAKRNMRSATVVVTERPTGKLVIEIDG